MTSGDMNLKFISMIFKLTRDLFPSTRIEYELAQRTRHVSISPEPGSPSGITYFAYNDNVSNGFPSPWRAAFPDSNPLGYWEAFAKRCSTVSQSTGGLVDAKTARRVWLSILGEYEDYERMGMWIPDQIMDEHRRVADALGWR